MAHETVVFARLLINDLGFYNEETRSHLKLRDNAKSIGDLRVIQMYEEAIIHKSKILLKNRKGNWVQKYFNANDINLFVTAQFLRYEDIKYRLEENFENIEQLESRVGELTSD